MIDFLGIGALRDADRLEDTEADTLGHVAHACARGECDS